MNVASTVIVALAVVAAVFARSSSSRFAFVSTWANQNHRRDASSSATAPDDPAGTFRRMMYQYDATNRWTNIGSQRRDRQETQLWITKPLENLMGAASSFLRDVTSQDSTFRDDETAVSADDKSQNGIGKVVRTAARPYMKEKSRPGRPGYTTRKNSLPQIVVDKTGVSGDYNDYRSRVLQSTPDRAISILTSDVVAYVTGTESAFRALREGDLGENVHITGVSYSFFEVGKRYRFWNKNQEEGAGGSVVIEITEPAVPCANLCNLKFINSELLEPRQRIQKCQDFLEKLSIDDGFRGWYAKVIGAGGTIRPGDLVALVTG